VLPTPIEAFAGLVLLFLLPLPLGAALLRLGENLVGRKFRLSVVERALLAFYVTGGALFVLASVPVPWYGLETVLALFGAGIVAYALLCLRDRGAGLRPAIRFVASPLGVGLGLGTLALVALELGAVSNVPLPNAYDGSMNTIWVDLILSGHTAPWTLAPYANWGITYPLSTAVWMTLPPMLFAWPAAQSPLLLPPLFLSLGVPSAYCWGTRLGVPGSREPRMLGPLFAAYFAVLASWPRLFVGGSYDFGFALPLLFLLLAWLRPIVDGALRSYREFALLGVAVGCLTALNAAAAQFFVLALIAYAVTFRVRSLPDLRRWTIGIGIVVAVSLAFVIRTLVAFAAWYGYPGHVLQETGSPPYVAPPIGYSFGPRLVMGELDPFLPWKAKLSPIPGIALELQLLLGVGVILLVLIYLVRSSRVRALVPPRFAGAVTAGTLVALFATSLAVALLVPGSPLVTLEWVTSLDELSTILFVFLGLIALLPIASALLLLDAYRSAQASKSLSPSNSTKHGPARPFRLDAPYPPTRTTVVALVLVVAVPFATGAYATVADAPSYILSKTLSTGNATQQDLSALTWAGANLPSCARVLVAPASAAQFLPEYAHVGIVFPMLPVPVNLSYQVAVSDLTAGVYTNVTHAALVSLRVSEVFGTGVTFGAYPAFNLTRLLQDPAPDFQVLYTNGDASILAFLPGAAELACPV
jgi:hypothetical protein